LLSFSDGQLRLVIKAAEMIPVSQRDSFLRSIAGRLADLHQPTLGDVQAAIVFVLNTRGIAVGADLFHAEANKQRRCSHGRVPFTPPTQRTG
jgi:hypothetical protein